VARRALALTAVTSRAIFEQEPLHPGAAPTHVELLVWVKAIGIGDELEPDEWEVLQRPLGRLESRAQIDSTWRVKQNRS